MAHILILKGDKPSHDSGAYHMGVALSDIGLDRYDVRSYRDLVFSMTNRDTSVWFLTDGTGLSEFDLVYLRDFYGYEFEQNACALYLRARRKKFLSRESLNFAHRSKLTQYMKLALSDVSVPDTFFCRVEKLNAQRRKLGAGFPLILKSITGRGGGSNFLVRNESDLLSITRRRSNQKYVIQRFIPNQGDYRVIVFMGEVVCAYKRQRVTGTHLNNVAQGAKRELVKLDSKLSDLAVKAADAIGRDLSGVDIVVDESTGRAYVLEVNFNFGMERMSDGIDRAYFRAVAKKLHDFIG